MRKLYLFSLTIFFGMQFAFAQDKTNQTADLKVESYYLLPQESVDATKTYTGKQIVKKYRKFLKSVRGRSFKKISSYYGIELTSAGFAMHGPTNSSQAVKQANCYRCALGQEISPANEDWCQKEFSIWNGTKKEAKTTCH